MQEKFMIETKKLAEEAMKALICLRDHGFNSPYKESGQHYVKRVEHEMDCCKGAFGIEDPRSFMRESIRFMKGFIEVTRTNNSEYNGKTLIPLANIKYIDKSEDRTYIVLKIFYFKGNKPWCPVGISVKESYEEVLALIAKATE